MVHDDNSLSEIQIPEKLKTINARLGSDLVIEKTMTYGYTEDILYSVSCSSNHCGNHTCSLDGAWFSRQEKNASTWDEDDHSVPLCSD